MWSDVFNIAITNGIFACLFVALLVYTLKETKYQNIIDKLSNKLNTVDEIKQDVSEIKKCIMTTPVKRRKCEKTD